MTLDEALRKFDLSQLNTIHLVVLEAAVAALARSHPNPAALRRDFDSFYSRMKVAAEAISPGESPATSVVASHLIDQLFPEKGGTTDRK